MKNILIVVDIYPPEISSAAHLTQELAEGLRKRGHQVWVLTSYPRQSLSDDLRSRVVLPWAEENGVHVIRAETFPLRNVPFFIRGISQLLLPFLFFRQAKRRITGHLDAVIVYSPPLPLALVGGMVKKYWKAKSILLLEDIFPQNAIDLGILTGWLKQPAVRLFEAIEKRAYREADVITFHAEGGRRFLIEHKGIPAEKIVTVAHWVDLDFYRRPGVSESFRTRWGLSDRFIILFGGIIGPAQGLDFLVEVAREVVDLEDLIFLVVGDGMEKEKLQTLIAEHRLTNIIVKPFVSKEDYPSLVWEADVGLVCLSAKNKTPFIPGKFLGYMACAKPVLAFLNKESDSFALVENAQCGYATVAGQREAAIQAVRRMYRERALLAQQGRNGLAWAKTHLSLDVCLDKIERLL